MGSLSRIRFRILPAVLRRRAGAGAGEDARLPALSARAAEVLSLDEASHSGPGWPRSPGDRAPPPCLRYLCTASEVKLLTSFCTEGEKWIFCDLKSGCFNNFKKMGFLSLLNLGRVAKLLRFPSY